jgi:hypothetical protein
MYASLLRILAAFLVGSSNTALGLGKHICQVAEVCIDGNTSIEVRDGSMLIRHASGNLIGRHIYCSTLRSHVDDRVKLGSKPKGGLVLDGRFVVDATGQTAHPMKIRKLDQWIVSDYSDADLPLARGRTAILVLNKGLWRNAMRGKEDLPTAAVLRLCGPAL